MRCICAVPYNKINVTNSVSKMTNFEKYINPNFFFINNGFIFFLFNNTLPCQQIYASQKRNLESLAA